MSLAKNCRGTPADFAKARLPTRPMRTAFASVVPHEPHAQSLCERDFPQAPCTQPLRARFPTNPCAQPLQAFELRGHQSFAYYPMAIWVRLAAVSMGCSLAYVCPDLASPWPMSAQTCITLAYVCPDLASQGASLALLTPSTQHMGPQPEEPFAYSTRHGPLI